VRFAKFAVIGLTNTAIAFAVFNLAAVFFHVPAFWANVLAWLAGFANSFLWNRAWTFADRRQGAVGVVLLRFAVANAAALAVSSVVIVALQAATGLGDGGAPASAAELNAIEAAAIGAALCVNYVISSRWVFRS
jgi:putative flippase GtrA